MRVIVVSGYFNPIHSGHINYLEAAANLGDHLVAIVNNDFQVTLKGSKPFMDCAERLRIVQSLGCVNRAVKSVDSDASVVQTLEMLLNSYSLDYFFHSMTFANGGDRKPDQTPEELFCDTHDVATVYDVGGGKTQSSSDFLDQFDLSKFGDTEKVTQ
jgi:D-beta-D-heptose 7-phosphate kinase/D-beta-D-heptose 1-phosphate adenosyltransferase